MFWKTKIYKRLWKCYHNLFNKRVQYVTELPIYFYSAYEPPFDSENQISEDPVPDIWNNEKHLQYLSN
jgi:hypothetical protein